MCLCFYCTLAIASIFLHSIYLSTTFVILLAYIFAIVQHYFWLGNGLLQVFQTNDTGLPSSSFVCYLIGG